MGQYRTLEISLGLLIDCCQAADAGGSRALQSDERIDWLVVVRASYLQQLIKNPLRL